MRRLSPPPRRHRSADTFSGWRRVLIVPIALAEVMLAWMAAIQPGLILVGLFGGAALVAALVAPSVVLLAAMPSTFAYWRVGPGVIDMSVTDAVTVLGAIAAVPFVPWRSRGLRIILGALACYLGVLVISVAASPSQGAAFEVFHRGMIVVGAVFIGSALAARGQTRLALRILLGMSMVISVIAVAVSARSGFQPAYPLGMHKNAVGAMFTSCLIVLMVLNKPLGFSRLVTFVCSAVIGLGLVASQSRAAMLGLFFVVTVHMIQTGRRSGARGVVRFAPVMLVGAIVLLGISIVSFSEQQASTTESEAVYGSLGSRTNSYEYAIQHVWKPHILFGSGPKFFTSGQAGSIIPHNIVVLELAEAGILGLLGLFLFLTAVLMVVARSRTRLGDAAFLVLLERVLEAMLSIFWVAGTGTIPFLLVGLVIGEDAVRDEDSQVTDDLGLPVDEIDLRVPHR